MRSSLRGLCNQRRRISAARGSETALSRRPHSISASLGGLRSRRVARLCRLSCAAFAASSRVHLCGRAASRSVSDPAKPSASFSSAVSNRLMVASLGPMTSGSGESVVYARSACPIHALNARTTPRSDALLRAESGRDVCVHAGSVEKRRSCRFGLHGFASRRSPVRSRHAPLVNSRESLGGERTRLRLHPTPPPQQRSQSAHQVGLT
jgi:hypothetical protein